MVEGRGAGEGTPHRKGGRTGAQEPRRRATLAGEPRDGGGRAGGEEQRPGMEGRRSLAVRDGGRPGKSGAEQAAGGARGSRLRKMARGIGLLFLPSRG